MVGTIFKIISSEGYMFYRQLSSWVYFPLVKLTFPKHFLFASNLTTHENSLRIC